MTPHDIVADGATIELTRFRVAPEKVEQLLAARPRMLEDFRADRRGFIYARLVRLPEDQWLDIVTWETPEDFAASRAKGANLPGIKAFFEAIDELVSAEEGRLADRAG
jgi:quinol monooxygenase YgiN